MSAQWPWPDGFDPAGSPVTARNEITTDLDARDPAEVYGPDLVLAVAGVERIDRS